MKKDEDRLFFYRTLALSMTVLTLLFASTLDQLKEENARLKEQIRTYQIITETGRNGG